jgi:hypothetical protein
MITHPNPIGYPPKCKKITISAADGRMIGPDLHR